MAKTVGKGGAGVGGNRPVSAKTGRPIVQARAQETRKAILAAALTAFAEHGFADANMREIAKAAGTTHPMVTYHFGTKDGLWREAVTHMFTRFEEQVSKKLAEDRHLPPRDQYRRMIRRYARYCAENPEHARITLMETIRGGERLEWMVETFVLEAHRVAVPWLEWLMEEGVIVRMPAVTFLYMMVSMLQQPFVLAKEAEIALGYDMLSESSIMRQADAVLAFTMIPEPSGS